MLSEEVKTIYTIKYVTTVNVRRKNVCCTLVESIKYRANKLIWGNLFKTTIKNIKNKRMMLYNNIINVFLRIHINIP